MIVNVKQKQTNKRLWLIVGLVAALLAAPNAMVIRQAVNEVNPLVFNALRFGLIAVVLTPYVWLKRETLNRQSIKYALLFGLTMAIAVMAYVSAVKASQASYVSIITLITPVFFIAYGVKLNNEKIDRRSFAGITLAAAGAFTIVALPILLHQGSSFVFYPLATALGLGNAIFFPLAIIFSMRSHKAGAPMIVTLGISAWAIFLPLSVALLIQRPSIPEMNTNTIISVLYSAFVVALLARTLNVVSYERLGSIMNSALSYIETLVAILLPVFILHEKLSIEMVVGGVLILLGVYVVEHHKSPHHKHAHIWRHH